MAMLFELARQSELLESNVGLDRQLLSGEI